MHEVGRSPLDGSLVNIAFVKPFFKRLPRKAAICSIQRCISEIQIFYFENAHLGYLWTASVFHGNGSSRKVRAFSHWRCCDFNISPPLSPRKHNTRPARAHPRRRFCGGGGSWCCVNLMLAGMCVVVFVTHLI